MRHRIAGFTLLELMTALTVLAILLGLAVPAFTDIVRGNQIAAESSNLISALQLARSEALKRGMRVSVCAATAAGNACTENDNWSAGWIMFLDDFGAAGVREASDELLQSWPGPANAVTVTTDATAVTFSRTARAEFPESFRISKSGCGQDQLRVVDVALSGRIALRREDC